MRKFWIALMSVVLLLGVLTGCKDTTPERQMEALEEELLRLDMELKSEFYLAFGDEITEQIASQYNRKENRESASYTVKVKVPDVAALTDADIAVPVPDYDLNVTRADVFLAEYELSVRAKLDSLVKLKTDDGLVERELVFALKKTNGAWEASVSRADMQRLKDEIASGIDLRVSAVEECAAYQELLAANLFTEKISSAELDSVLVNEIRIEAVEESKSEGFSIAYSCPDYAAVYQTAADAAYDDIASSETWLFYDISDADFEGFYVANLKEVLQFAPVSFVEQKLNIVSEEDMDAKLADVVAGINNARQASAEAAVQRVNDELIVREVEKPKTSVLSGESKGVSVKVKTSAEVGDMFLTFYKLSGYDLNEEAPVTLTAYIHAGDSLTVRLPAGMYKLVQGSGDVWYGEAIAFGPYGRYDLTDEVLDLDGSYTYTLELYGVADGNLPSERIPYPFG